MNLHGYWLRHHKEEKVVDELEEDDDNSESWSLPDWRELEKARRKQAKRKRRLDRLRRKRALLLAAEEEAHRQEKLKEKEKSDTHSHILKASGSSISLNDEEDSEEDIPEDMKNRGKWNNSCEFLLSIISMSVGMGNFYRFPFVAYQNGGGAFLIPYIIVLTFVARPLYLMELALGQFCSYGQVKCWEVSPFFRGVGYGSALGTFSVTTYYSSVMGVSLYYLVNSFRETLPWAECDPEWAGEDVCKNIVNVTKHNSSVDPKMIANLPKLYFQKQVINEISGIDEGIGTPQTIQTVCLFTSWIIIFLIILRGVQSSGRVTYFTAFYPYFIILIMLITVCTKEGSTQGMLYFITPEWSRILDPSVWFAATGQCFFSQSIGFGPIISYSSYNPFHHYIYKDVIIVSFMDTLASFMCGLTIFATLGTISHSLNKPISEIVGSGPALLFVTFSDAISNFNTVPIPQVLAFLFFSMLLIITIGGAVAWQMASISIICDQFPKVSRHLITVIMCIIGFLIGLIYVTPGGQYMLTLVDNFGGNVNIYILATFECIAIAWVYGLKNFCQDIEFMLNKKVGWYWKICWGFIIPVMLTAVMIYTFATAKRLEHNGRPFPDSAIICGWLLTVASVMFFPLGAIYAIIKQKGTFTERLLTSLKPTSDWGPRIPHNRERWELYKKGVIAAGGPAPDTYQLPEGETPEDNTLPEWLTAKQDGTVVKTNELDEELELVEILSIHSNNNVNRVLSSKHSP